MLLFGGLLTAQKLVKKREKFLRNVKMMDLQDIPELHDKIIVSTAKYLDVSIITKDSILQSLSHIKTVW